MNGVSPNMVKTLDDENKYVLYLFIKDWMNNSMITYEQWTKSRLVPLPKKGNLHDLNNWRGINLLDVVSKIVSIILNRRAQKLLEKNSHPMQFGATPKVGCAEAVFSLKTILQSRREHDLETFIIFIDLVKAYDSIKHEIISIALKKMGALDKFIQWVEKLYGDFNVILKVGKEEICIEYGCGVWQGDNLVPTLFIIVMQLVAENIINELIKAKIQLPSIKCSKTSEGVMRLHNEVDMEELIDRHINMLTYMDDGAGLFNCREDVVKGSVVICEVMAKWGLTVHVGYDDSKSKTELMYIPSTSKLKE